MLFRIINRLSVFQNLVSRRSCSASRISSLFVNNFDKYIEKINNDRETHEKKELTRLLHQFTQLSTSIKDVEKELSGGAPQSDKELTGLMKEEKLELEAKRNELISEVLNEIYYYELSNDAERIPDSASVLFEVSAGVGGKEAMLFANELCDLYTNFFALKRWDVVDVEADQQAGYLRHYQAKVEGRDVWGFMRFEAGVHRVQRVPETETRGRVHTSTVTIACIPIIVDDGVEINGKLDCTLVFPKYD
jgi:peptide chain release factor 1